MSHPDCRCPYRIFSNLDSTGKRNSVNSQSIWLPAIRSSAGN